MALLLHSGLKLNLPGSTAAACTGEVKHHVCRVGRHEADGGCERLLMLTVSVGCSPVGTPVVVNLAGKQPIEK